MSTNRTRIYLRLPAFHLRPSAVSRICVSLVLLVGTLAHAEVTAKDAWVRGTVPAQKITGAFMTLTSTEDAKIVGASSPAAKKAEIHSSMMMGGVNHMHAIDAIALPAGKPVELKPGGNHVMLMDLARQVKPGDVVPIVFTIEGRDGKRTQFEVKATARPLGGQ